MDNIPVASVISSLKSNNEAKERILTSMKIAIKQIQSYYSTCSLGDPLPVTLNEVHQLCDSLDKTLFYGLQKCQDGYWPFVKDFTHSNTVKYIESFSSASSQIQCGRAWLCLALNENSLESYFRSFWDNPVLVKKHFLTLSILRDEQQMQLVLMLISGLETIPFNFEIDKVSLGTGMSFFNSYCYCCSDGSQSYCSSELSQFENCATSSQCSSQDMENECDDSPEGLRMNDEKYSKNSSQCHHQKSKCLSYNLSNNELERITKYINLPPQNGDLVDLDLEVIRTKVVRRVKRSPVESRKIEKELAVDSAKSSTVSKENRLSKATTDSGVSLESHCLSDRDSPELNKQILNKEPSFDQFHTEINVAFSTPIKSVTTMFLPEERGVPEGQEDPVPDHCSNVVDRQPLQPGNDGVDGRQKAEEEEQSDEEEISIYDLHKIRHYKVEEDCISVGSAGSDVTENEEIESVDDGEKMIDPVAEELSLLAMNEREERYDFKVDNGTLLFFLVEIYDFEEEQFFKIFPVYLNITKGNDQMVLFLLTTQCAYILKPGGSECKFTCYDSTKYSNIEYISVNLNYQGFTIVSHNNHQLQLFTADEHLTQSILSNMEVIIRRSVPKIKIPSVNTSAALQIKNMTKYLATELETMSCNIRIDHFVLARWENFDGNSTSSFTPAGPKQEGKLMYRRFLKDNSLTEEMPWCIGYFMLKGGVLYCMDDSNESVPLFFIQICAPHCKGVRRVHFPKWPYVLEVLLPDGESVHLAADDEGEISLWQQSCQHALSLAGHFIDNDEPKSIPGCIILCNDIIVVAKELSLKTVHTLVSANLCDLSAVHADCSVPNCVLLEFEIADASKSLGEWILTFDSVLETEKFMDVLKERWLQMFQVELTIVAVQELSLRHKLSITADGISLQKQQLAQLCYES